MQFRQACSYLFVEESDVRTKMNAYNAKHALVLPVTSDTSRAEERKLILRLEMVLRIAFTPGDFVPAFSNLKIDYLDLQPWLHGSLLIFDPIRRDTWFATSTVWSCRLVAWTRRSKYESEVRSGIPSYKKYASPTCLEAIACFSNDYTVFQCTTSLYGP